MDFGRESRLARDGQFSSGVVPKAGSASQLAYPRSRPVFSKTGRFRRADRVLRARDFTHALKSGERWSSESFAVVISARVNTPVDEPAGSQVELGVDRRRLGVTVGKRVGNSVIRNRLKRCIREWFRHAREDLPAGSDTVVIARRSAGDLSGSDVRATLDKMIYNAKARGADRSVAESR